MLLPLLLLQRRRRLPLSLPPLCSCCCCCGSCSSIDGSYIHSRRIDVLLMGSKINDCISAFIVSAKRAHRVLQGCDARRKGASVRVARSSLKNIPHTLRSVGGTSHAASGTSHARLAVRWCAAASAVRSAQCAASGTRSAVLSRR